MPPHFRPAPVIGKRPPLMLPRGFSAAPDMSGDGWPSCLLIATGAGLLDTPGLRYGFTAANEAGFIAAPDVRH